MGVADLIKKFESISKEEGDPAVDTSSRSKPLKSDDEARDPSEQELPVISQEDNVIAIGTSNDDGLAEEPLEIRSQKPETSEEQEKESSGKEEEMGFNSGNEVDSKTQKNDSDVGDFQESKEIKETSTEVPANNTVESDAIEENLAKETEGIAGSKQEENEEKEEHVEPKEVSSNNSSESIEEGSESEEDADIEQSNSEEPQNSENNTLQANDASTCSTTSKNRKKKNKKKNKKKKNANANANADIEASTSTSNNTNNSTGNSTCRSGDTANTNINITDATMSSTSSAVQEVNNLEVVDDPCLRH